MCVCDCDIHNFFKCSKVEPVRCTCGENMAPNLKAILVVNRRRVAEN